jgi:hypothetical protein
MSITPNIIMICINMQGEINYSCHRFADWALSDQRLVLHQIGRNSSGVPSGSERAPRIPDFPRMKKWKQEIKQ